MIKFIALMDEFGNELSYEGYSRQRLPGEENWEIATFSMYNGPIMRVIGMWVCESETSRMRDGEYHQFVSPLTLERGMTPNVHVRGIT